MLNQDSEQYENQKAILTDEFLERVRLGESPAVADYASRIPERFDEIEEYLETLLFAENMRTNHRPNSFEDLNAEAAPTEIGGYEILGVLGRGGVGTVYEAAHPRLQRRVAIKVLNRERASSRSFEDRFQREAETTARLHHPSIVSLHDFGEDDGRNFLVMQFVEGVSLDKTLNEYLDAVDTGDTSDVTAATARAESHFIATDFAAVARIGADVASALAHAHSKHAIHRDIKPANLILDRDGKIWVTDFGLAKLRDEDTDLSRTGDQIGTPRYMAPEQIRGYCDERSDVYSLGVTLYELACGQRAWESDLSGPVEQLLTAKSAMELPDVRDVNPNVPVALAGIIMRACAFRPQDRYQSAEELRVVLKRFETGQQVADRRRSPRDVSNRPYLRRRFLLFALLTSFLVGVLFSGPSDRRGDETMSEATDLTSYSPLDVSVPVTVAENVTSIGQVPCPESLSKGATWELEGADADFFSIDDFGVLSFRAPVDFESAGDANADGHFDVVATVADQNGNRIPVMNKGVQLIDVNESPVFRGKFGSRQIKPNEELRHGQLRADDPEGFGFHWVCQTHFAQICVDLFGRIYSLPGQNQPLGEGTVISVEANDSAAQHSAVFYKRGNCYMQRVNPNGELVGAPEMVKLPAGLRGITTVDGFQFLCIAKEPDRDTVGLYLTDLQQSKCLNPDCGLPADAKGLASADGEQFFYSARGAIWSTQLIDGQFEGRDFVRPVRPESKDLVATQPDRLYAAHLSQRELMMECFLADVGVIQLTPLAVGRIESMVGMCAWFEQNTAEATNATVAKLRVE